jgi:hypothetical protein
MRPATTTNTDTHHRLPSLVAFLPGVAGSLFFGFASLGLLASRSADDFNILLGSLSRFGVDRKKLTSSVSASSAWQL